MQVDSFLIYDLRAFARDYEGSPLSSRITTAANELDRLHEIERHYSWRPIDTAPKDGTTIIVWCVHEMAKFCENPASEGYAAPAIARWINHNGGGWTWHGLAGPPTLWMPLPKVLPAERAQQDRS